MAQLDLQLDGSQFVKSAEIIVSALTELKASFASFAQLPSQKITSDLQSVRTAMATTSGVINAELSKMIKGTQAMQAEAGKAGRDVGNALADGLKSGGDTAVMTMREQTQKMQVEFERMVALGVQFDAESLKRLRAQGVNVGPSFKAESFDTKPLETANTRLLANLKRDSAQLDAQMETADTRLLANLQKSSAKLEAGMETADARLLANLKRASAQLDAQMETADTRLLANLKRASAKLEADMETADTRLLANLQRSSAKLAAQMETADTRLLANLKKSSAERNALIDKDARFNSVSPTAQLSRATVVSGALSGGMGEVDAVKRYGAEAVNAAKNLDQLVLAANATTSAKKKLADTSGEVSNAFKLQTGHANDLHSAYRGLASGFDAMWLTWGSILPLLAGAGISHAFTSAVKAGSEFEQTMITIRELAGVAAEDMSKLSAEALKLGSTTQYGPNEVAKGLKELALAGLDAKEQLQAITPVLNFATVGEIPLDKAAKSLVAISTAFGYTATGFGAVGDVIAKAAAVSMSSVADMTEAFRTASTVAQQFKVTVSDASTVLALLAQVGIKGSAAGTAMRSMYTELIGASKATRDLLKDTLHVDVIDNATKAMKPLVVIVAELGKEIAKYDFRGQIDILEKLGGQKGGKAISAVLTAAVTELKGGAGEISTVLADLQEKLADAPGFVATAAAGMALSSANQIKSVGNAMQTALIKAFEGASPAIQQLAIDMRNVFNSNEFAEGLKTIVSGVAELAGWLTKHIDIIAAVAAGFAIGTTALIAMNAAVAIATVALPAMGLAWGAVTSGAAIGVGAIATALLPLTLAVAAVGTAWYVFGNNAESAAKKASDANNTRLEATLEGFAKEEARLIEQRRLRREGTDQIVSNAYVEASLMVRQTVQANDLARTFDQLAHAKLLASRALLAGSEYANTAQGAKALLQADQSLADSRGRMADTVLSHLAAENKGREQARRLRSEAQQDRAEANNLAAESGNRPAGTLKYDPDAKSARAAKAPYIEPESELGVIRDHLKNREDLLKNSYDHERKMLDIQHKYGLVAEGSYQSQVLRQTVEYEAERKRARGEESGRFADEVKSRTLVLEDKLRGDPEKLAGRMKSLNAEVAKFNDKNNTDNQKDAQDGEARRAEGLAKMSGELRKATGDLDSYLLKMQQDLQTSRDVEAARRSLLGAPEEVRASAEAFAKFTGDHAGAIEKLGTSYKSAAADALDAKIAFLIADSEGSSATGELKTKMDDMAARAEALRTNLEKLRAGSQSGAQQSSVLAFDNSLDKQVEAMDRLLDPSKAHHFGNVLKSAFQGADGAMGKLVNSLDSYGVKQAEIDKMREIYGKRYGVDSEKYASANEKITAKETRNTLSSYADMAGAASGFFEKGSKGYKTLQAVSQAFHAVELAMSIASMVQKALETTTTVVTNGVKTTSNVATGASAFFAQSGWAGFAGVAAMLAVMASLGFAGGGGGGGGDVPAGSDTELQKTAGTGTVLGDPKAKSDTLAKSLDLLEKAASGTFSVSNKMLDALRSINTNISGLTNAIARQVGVSGGLFDTSGLSLGKTRVQNNPDTGPVNLFGADSGIGKLSNTISNFIFGGNQTRTLTGQGIQFAPQTFGQAARKLDASAYQTVNTKTDGGLFGSDKNSQDTVLVALDGKISTWLSKTIGSVATALGTAGEMLGVKGAKEIVDGMQLGLDKLPLMGLSGEEQGKLISATLGAAFDNLSLQLLPWLKDFQNVGEGAGLTMVRVSTELAIVNSAFGDMHLPLLALGQAGVTVAEGLIAASGGLDKLTANLATYYDKFFTDAEKSANSVRNLQRGFADLGLAVPASKDAFNTLVKGIDLTTSSGQTLLAGVLQLAPAFANVADAALAAADRMRQQISGVVADYLNSDELRNFRAGEIQSTLSKGGVSLTAEQILGASRADARALYESYNANPGAEQTPAQTAAQTAILNAADKFTALSAPKVPAAQASSGGSGGGSSGTSAADSIKAAWQSITDSIWGEVKRIQGLLAGTGAEGYALAQAKFSTATVLARGGDQEAAKSLPTLSTALLTLAENNTSTLLELQRVRGRTAGSLEETGSILSAQFGTKLPSFAVGTDYVPNDMLALIHEGERITPKAFNPTIGGGAGNAELAAEIRALRDELASQKAAGRETADNTRALASLLVRVTHGGEAMQTQVAS